MCLKFLNWNEKDIVNININIYDDFLKIGFKDMFI